MLNPPDDWQKLPGYLHKVLLIPTDCYAGPALAILPKYSHIVGLASHFYAHTWAGPKLHAPPLSKLRWSLEFLILVSCSILQGLGFEKNLKS